MFLSQACREDNDESANTSEQVPKTFEEYEQQMEQFEDHTMWNWLSPEQYYSIKETLAGGD
jgi:hypothetical protein